MKSVTIIPEICVHDARGAILFYKRAFGAKDLGTHATPDGKRIMHCGLELNGGVVFVRDDFPEAGGGPRTPKALGGTSVTVHLNCADVQSTWKAAVKAGAKVVMPLAKQFWGDVYGIVDDPFGQRWSMSASHGDGKPDTAGDEYKSGADEMFPTAKKKKAGGAKKVKAKVKKK